MNRLLLLLPLVLLQCQPAARFSPAEEEKAIRDVLAQQQAAWNAGSLEGFMEGYWKSDSLKFVGAQITTGWDATLARYKRSYPDLATMGQLTFEFYGFQFLAPDVCLVTGRYTLARANDNPTGLFTLVVRKIEGRWLVTYDHTS